jgi:lipopolysaccharide heptosyltransferase II
MGDLLMTTPAIRALKESHSRRRITLLTSQAGAAVSPMLPEVDDCWIYESPWMKATPPRPNSHADFDMIRSLRSGGFDAAVIFTVFSQNPLPTALLCHLADIPLRLAHCRENPYHLLTHWVRDPEVGGALRHEVRRQLDLVATVGARPSHERLSLRVPNSARQHVTHLLQTLKIDRDGTWAVVHPGASAPSRRYASESFARVGRSLALGSGCRVIFTGDASERALVESIREQMGVPSHSDSVAGALSLAELAALIERAPVLIANNTGPVHIAAAVGTPVVDLYALTNPQHTPWIVPSRVLNHDVPCQPCYKSVCPEGHHHCLQLVEPGEVVRAALELLEQPESPNRRREVPERNLAGSLHG